MKNGLIRIAGITKRSTVNGPRERAVLHVQGCSLKCPGCFNTHTWDFNKGTLLPILEVVTELLEDNPCGEVTISGGEPLQQEEQILQVLTLLKVMGPSSGRVIMFTGLSIDEIGDSLWLRLCHSGLDALISGRYEREHAVFDRGLLSSSNQQLLLLSNKFSNEELDSGLSQVEIIIEEDGQIGMSGFPGLSVINQIRREA